MRLLYLWFLARMLTASYCSQCWGNNVVCGIKTRWCHDSSVFTTLCFSCLATAYPKKFNSVGSEENDFCHPLPGWMLWSAHGYRELFCVCKVTPMASAAVRESQNLYSVHLCFRLLSQISLEVIRNLKDLTLCFTHGQISLLWLFSKTTVFEKLKL